MPHGYIAAARQYLDQAAQDPDDVSSLRMAQRMALKALDEHLKTPHLLLTAEPGDNPYDVLLAVAKDEGFDSINEALAFVVGEWTAMVADRVNMKPITAH